MLSDGTIMIDGPKIVIGSGINNQTQIGREATEPIVLGNVLVRELVDLIGKIIDQINLISVPTGVGPSGPPVNAPAFTGIKLTLQSKLDACKSKVGKIK